MVIQKECFKCKKVQPITEFYKHPQMRDGHLNKCKTCTKADVQTRYEEKGATDIKEYEKRRFQTPERKAKIKVYQANRRAKDPVKTATRYLTSNAIRDGKLVRQPCEVCGKERSEAHHTDYMKPLEVEWLCRKHHLERHNKRSWADDRETQTETVSQV